MESRNADLPRPPWDPGNSSILGDSEILATVGRHLQEVQETGYGCGQCANLFVKSFEDPVR